jgi:tetratricopeptide (TPR) repeat protein
VLPKAAEHFTGRHEEIEWLKAQLRKGKRIALVGPGGIGKTAIAHEAIAALSPPTDPFAHFAGGIFLHDFYAAPSHLSAIESINREAGITGLQDHEREPSARTLLNGPPALIFLEGCEKAEDLPRFLDLSAAATILITTRRNDDAKGAIWRPIDPLVENEAAEMLYRHAAAACSARGGDTPIEGDTEPIWREIAGLLGRHPLALRLAGHRIGSGNETATEFDKLLREEGFAHFDDDRRTKESLDLLFTHSADVLSAHGRGAWYALALHALAPIPLAPLAVALGLEDTEARKALGELVHHSLADAVRMPSEDGTTEPAWLLAHALLPEWGRSMLAEHGVHTGAVFKRWRNWWFVFLYRCFEAAHVPGGPARYDALSEHFDALLDNLAAREGAKSLTLLGVLSQIGNVHQLMGRRVAAETCYRRHLAVSEEVEGSEHPNTLSSLNNLASLLDDKGDRDEAELLHRRALEARERLLGPEDPDTLSSLSNLAVLLRAKGDSAGSEALYHRVFEARERVLGAEHPDTLCTLNNLAIGLRADGDLAAAEPSLRRVLEVRERVLPPEHPDTLSSLINLANLLYAKGDWAGAEPLCRRAVEWSERRLGSDHPLTLSALNNLATLLAAKGDQDQAESLYRRVLDARERVLGPEHSETLSSVYNLALNLSRKGDLAGAEPLARRAVEGFAKALPLTHAWRRDAELLLIKIRAARGGTDA